jgi:hypothetical protein
MWIADNLHTLAARPRAVRLPPPRPDLRYNITLIVIILLYYRKGLYGLRVILLYTGKVVSLL